MAGGMLLQSAATDAGNGSVAKCFWIAGEYVGTVITSDAAITAGDVTFEHAISDAGPWEALGPAIAADRNTTQSFRFRGAYNYIRGRISAAVTGGGNVTVRLQTPVPGES